MRNFSDRFVEKKQPFYVKYLPPQIVLFMK